RLNDAVFRESVGQALAARFKEVIVDEAQDCNPFDLEIITWLRASGIPVKIICDPNQSIYGFRGGVTEELRSYSSKFPKEEQLELSGNFRSTPAICAANYSLRPPNLRVKRDNAMGNLRDSAVPVQI